MSRWLALAAAAVLAGSACGIRVSHDEVVHAAGGQLTTAERGSGESSGGTEQLSDVTQGGSAGAATPSSDGATSSGIPSGAPSGQQASTANKAPAGPAIVVGNVGTYSGPGGSSTAAAPAALRVWAASTNANGGINGHPVEVVIADDGGDPTQTKALLQDMVENKKVVAIVGMLVPFTDRVAAGYLESKRIPAVGGNLGPVWHESPMLFPQGSSFETMVVGGLQAAAKAGSKTLAMLYCGEAQACTEWKDVVANGGAQRAGVTLAYTAQISIAQPDFTAECINAQSRGVDVIDIAADANTMRRIAESCQRQGYHPRFTSGGLPITGDLASQPNLEGMIVSQNFFPWPSSAGAAAEFQAAMKQYAPKVENSSATAAEWTSGQLLKRALSSVGAGPVTTQQVLEGLWSIQNDDLGGLTVPLTFVRDKPAPKGSNCYFVVTVRQQKWASGGDKAACLR